MTLTVSTMSQGYSKLFFAGQRGGSLASAEAVVPIVMQLVRPRSVIDVGCGVGPWASVFAAQGVATVHGVDGDYVDRDTLLIPPECFRAADLATGIGIDERYDLAVSLEVGEHLPFESSERFVEDLTRLAPVVLFSAAIPWQGGAHHINERWQQEWAALFAARGYVAVDAVRPRVWDHPEVDYWYAQNAVIYTTPEKLDELPELRAAGSDWPLDVVHPKHYHLQNTRGVGLRRWARRLPHEARYSVERRARRVRLRMASR